MVGASVVGTAALVAGLLSVPLAASAAPATEDFDVPSLSDVKKDLAKFEAGRYIVRLKDAPVASYDGGISGLAKTTVPTGKQLDATTSAVKKYTTYLTDAQDTLASKVGVDIDYNYTIATNGFAAKLSAAEAARLAKSDAVLSVEPTEILHVDAAEKSTDYLGLSDPGTGTWAQVGGVANAGKGIVIGDLDTGIAPENASFAGEPLGTTASTTEPYLDGTTVKYQKSDGKTFSSEQVTTGDQWNASYYSTKIIGAQYFVEGFGEAFIGAGAEGVDEYLSPRDGSGHGSHTASTAAGEPVTDASVEGVSFGPIVGVAPRAKLASYKVCWDGADPTVTTDDGCATDDLIAAVDAAVADGVDVINFSIGGGSATSVYTTLDEAFLNAAIAGVFVSASAGNSGPAASTADHASPWYATVAATTIPDYEGTVELGNGSKYLGATVTVPAGGTEGALVNASDNAATGKTAADANLCIADTLSAAVAGKIVVCDRGSNDRVAKSAEVERAGGIGMVLINATAPGAADDIDNDFHSVPSVHLHAAAHDAVHAYAATAGATVTLEPENTTSETTAVPQLADFSSHGPELASGADTLKPDISAPGVSILAAVANADDEEGLYAFYSGTSMAAPHVTGLAALYLTEKPNASVAEVKSAIMTTATPVLGSNGQQINDPFGEGAGNVHPLTYLEPGLYYPAGKSDWKKYLVGTGEVSSSDPGFAGVTGIDPSDLNQPSIAIGDLLGTQTVTRSVTALKGGTYTVSTEGLTGLGVTVSPTSLTIAEGATESYTVTFSTGSAPLDAWTTGALTWKNGSTAARSPIAIHPSTATVPTALESEGTTGSISIPVTGGIDSDVPVTVNGFTEGDMSRNETDPTLPYTDILVKGDDPYQSLHIVGEGTTSVEFDLEAVDGPVGTDFDLYLFYRPGTTGSFTDTGITSATAAASESIVLDDPEPGQYLTLVDPYETPAAGAKFKDIAWIYDPSEYVGSPTAVPSPLPLSVGKATSVDVDWAGLDPFSEYRGTVKYGSTPLTTSLTVTTDDAFVLENEVEPSIDGAATAGTTVTANTGTWNVPARRLGFGYQWTSNGAPIAGATSGSYTIPSSMLGSALGLTVTANIAGSTPVTLAARSKTVKGTDGGTTFASTAAPVITGTVQSGQTITASAGGFNIPTKDVALAYQWKLAGTDIAGATAATYTVPSSAIGKGISVTVSGTFAGTTVSATSLPATVAGTDGVPSLKNTVAPKLGGEPVTGKTLTTTTGSWNLPATDLSYTYQWYANEVPIAGATSASYKLGASKYRDSIKVLVTASLGSTITSSAFSDAVVVKAKAVTTIKIADSTITTKQKAKVTVTVAAGSKATETGLVVLHYGSKIKKYTLKKSDKGKAVFTLPKLKKGTYKIYANYRGNSTIDDDKSITKNLKVRTAPKKK